MESGSTGSQNKGVLKKIGSKVKKAKDSFRGSLSRKNLRRSLSRKSDSSLRGADSSDLGTSQEEYANKEAHMVIRRSLSESDSRISARIHRPSPSFKGQETQEKTGGLGSGEGSDKVQAPAAIQVEVRTPSPTAAGKDAQKSEGTASSKRRPPTSDGARSSFSDEAKEGTAGPKQHERGTSLLSDASEGMVFDVVAGKGEEKVVQEGAVEAVKEKAEEKKGLLAASTAPPVEVSTPPAEREPIKVVASMESAGLADSEEEILETNESEVKQSEKNMPQGKVAEKAGAKHVKADENIKPVKMVENKKAEKEIVVNIKKDAGGEKTLAAGKGAEKKKTDVKEMQKVAGEGSKGGEPSKQPPAEVIGKDGKTQEISMDDQTKRKEIGDKHEDADMLVAGVQSKATRDLKIEQVEQMRKSCSHIESMKGPQTEAPGPLRHSADIHEGQLQEVITGGAASQPNRRWRWVRRVVTPVTIVTGALLIGISRLH